MGIRLNEIDRNCKNELFNDNNNNNHHNKSSLILPKITGVKNFPIIKEYTNNNIFKNFYTEVNDKLSNKEILKDNDLKNRKFSGLKLEKEKLKYNNNNFLENDNDGTNKINNNINDKNKFSHRENKNKINEYISEKKVSKLNNGKINKK